MGKLLTIVLIGIKPSPQSLMGCGDFFIDKYNFA